jgi:hypothetical protein
VLPDGAKVGSATLRRRAYGNTDQTVHWFENEAGSSYVIGAAGQPGSTQ